MTHDKPLVVKFLDDELHRYSQSSALKFAIINEDGSLRSINSADELVAGMKVQHHLRGPGEVINTVGELPEEFRHLLSGYVGTVPEGTSNDPVPMTRTQEQSPEEELQPADVDLLRMPSQSIAFALRPD